MPQRLFLAHLLRNQHLAVLLLSTSAWLVLDVPKFNPFKLGTSVAIAQTFEDRTAEADRLLQEGIQQYQVSQWREALQTWEFALEIYRQIGNRAGEASTLGNIGVIYRLLGDYPIALDYTNQSLALTRELGDRAGEARTLGNMGTIYQLLGDYPTTLNYYNQILAIFRELGDRAGEAITLGNIGTIYQLLGDYPTALDYTNQSLALTRELGNRAGEAITLGNIGTIYRLLGDYPIALDYTNQSLVLKRELGDRAGEANTLGNIGTIYRLLGDYPTALNYYNQILAIFRELGDRAGEARTLDNMGTIYQLLGDYPTALDYTNQSLALTRELGNRAGEANTLGNIGTIYQNLGDYPTALDYTNQSLALTRELGDRAGEASTLGNIGVIYQNLGDYPTALDYYEQSLALTRELGDRAGEAITLDNMGTIYRLLSDYPTALDYTNQSLALKRELGDRAGEAITLGNMGTIYQNLGDYPTALDYTNQSLALTQELGDRAGEAANLGNIGVIYRLLGDYLTALDYINQSLALTRELGDRAREAANLGNIGVIYRLLGDYLTALDYYEQSLALKRELGDRAGEAITLSNIGALNQAIEQYDDALNHYQQSAAIAKSVGNRENVAKILSNIGEVLTQQNQIELAIVFLKESVNEYEVIREQNRALPTELQDRQESYTATIENTYRQLANLLLQQGRILESQQVLDRLKVQELDDYLRGVRGPEDQITILRPEREILERYRALQQTVITIGQELATLRKRFYDQGSLPPSDEQRFDDLLKLQEDLNNQFSQFLQRQDIQAIAGQLSPESRQTLEEAQREALFQELDNLQDDLQQLNAVLIYPLILETDTETRLELIITLPDPDTTPLRRTVQFDDKTALNQAILDLRQAIRNPSADAVTPAQTLYAYLVKPLEADLAAIEANLTNGEPPTIIYAPDGALRYIPLAALHDGEQWLAQRFRINNITAESLTNLEELPASSLSVLAGAFADPNTTYTVLVDGEPEEYSGLPFAGQEVENLAASLPQINHLMDSEFGWTQVRRFLGGSNIVHFATHATFVPGAPEDSFILFGNGDRAVLECLDDAIQTEDTLSCINNWQLNNVDLVVLSACETGLVDQLTDGKEVLGLGYQFQARGARAVVASLWKVSDGGTQALMDAFYSALQQPNISKSEALRQAQLALINGEFPALPEGVRGVVEWGDAAETHSLEETLERLSHPYYWAPFILIGNGL